MITHIEGILAEKSPTHAVIDCNGVGYLLKISINTSAAITESGKCKLFTHYAVNVDVRSGASNHLLFGFATNEERSVFRQLITVSGVSANTGNMILSTMSHSQAEQAIVAGDVSAFTAVKGIGPKLAQKIIVELKDKIVTGENNLDFYPNAGNTNQQEALSALASLGFDKKSARNALKKVQAESADLPVETLIKAALKLL